MNIKTEKKGDLIIVKVGDISRGDFHDLRVSIAKKVQKQIPLHLFGFLFLPVGVWNFSVLQDGNFELLDSVENGKNYRFLRVKSIFN
ncbi:MAG: hypothetical protein A2519_10920 [Candidatus Raymondbacteria bacterium RIFOXYD12_FULL_49_13]|uniref:Uncharacterized protein n=1 Tax=Candidatus Raymondbacteria bacterium RIFOXYD12_FULL_49_13 TaxID=1817890 RepID=A0A1F7F1G7_UNCRA|nr:MAG: hypothetical protein A2519_10920 [Candidatus Raymondbacteria bacterium RIFOXYD12_FULL_49_13]